MENIFFRSAKDITVVIKKKFAVNFQGEITTKFKIKNVDQISINKDKITIFVNEYRNPRYFFTEHVAYIDTPDQIIQFTKKK